MGEPTGHLDSMTCAVLLVKIALPDLSEGPKFVDASGRVFILHSVSRHYLLHLWTFMLELAKSPEQSGLTC